MSLGRLLLMPPPIKTRRGAGRRARWWRSLAEPEISGGADSKFVQQVLKFWAERRQRERGRGAAPPPLSSGGGRCVRFAAPPLRECERAERRRRRRGMAAAWTSLGLAAVAVVVVGIAMPASASAAAPAQPPAPAPSSDGTSIDQGIAYVLMLVALVLTYLIHPLDASSPYKLF
uniref:Arabinogalactan peptide 16 n=1 Tax=Oryza meridionalis TaxID=40149 RepID=A0A0E0E2B8_9ORYZ